MTTLKTTKHETQIARKMARRQIADSVQDAARGELEVFLRKYRDSFTCEELLDLLRQVHRQLPMRRS